MENLKDELESQEEKDFKKLMDKYTHEFFSKYYDKESDNLLLKDLGIIFCGKPGVVKEYEFQAEIINYIITRYMSKEEYYYVNNGKIFLTEKGKEYIKDEK